ncbi:dicer-like protein 1 [Lophiotrema nucula]|uniref:Dicer-like protein 1 n=1 Tax=Lophiotrema nucula TaxID=690887 RepID=A0A6A5ZQ16_9PLEO|nr:dicer-like protein 1 [Lophiotrema nucula]
MKRTTQITEKEVKDAIEATNDENLSIRDILAKQETSAQITSPRDYQTELFQKAKQENIIAVLDTGSGKTHIATLLLRHILDLELESRSKGGPNKIAFFLVDSVNLVFQQANVLRCGLDQGVEGVCGAMGASLWGKPTWDKLFANNMVIVCTAEVLVQCMMHSFITIPQVNLLIFDEAHHAKNNHPFARLIKDYYLNDPDPRKRPRIFGMTASPVDAKVDVRQAALDLETLLHCRIATTSDTALLQNNISRPEEEIVRYDRLRPPFETPFHQELKRAYGDVPAFQKFFTASKELSSELGAWASDMYWSFAFSEDEQRKIEMKEERKWHRTKTEKSMTKLDAEIKRLREAAKFVQQHDFSVSPIIPDDLSSKVLQLHDWLQRYYERTGEARCIVFVERRYTARLLNMLFSIIGGPNLHSDMLVGVNSQVGDLNISLRNQVMTVAKFRRGELNCLFSTSVAEEGLDIPQCNLVVRFDLYRTMIAYIQSRGRARHRNSKYLHMVENDNIDHRASVFEARSSEQTMRDFCSNLPADRFINELDDSVERFLTADRTMPSYTDPESGAKLTFRSSLSVLAHFVASLPAPNQEVITQPNYVVEHQGGRFICEVILPEYSPVISTKGRPYKKKIYAKCSAAFEMCLELRKKDLLDSNLLPTFTKQLPAMRNALLAISAKKKGKYGMRIKPEFWKYGYGTVPEHVFLTVINVSAGLDRPHQPLGLVTRRPLPQMPNFPIFLDNGRQSGVVSVHLTRAIPTDSELLHLLTQFTWNVHFDVFAKKFEFNVEHMSYWYVPIRNDLMEHISSGYDEPKDLIDWDQVELVAIQEEHKWTPGISNVFLMNRYLVDIHDGGRRFYTICPAPHLKPLGPVPKGVPNHKWMSNLLNYSTSMWGKGRASILASLDTNQEVFEVYKIPFRRNLLAQMEKDEEEQAEGQKAWVCPQPLKISALTTPLVAMLYLLPAIIHRYDSYLIALDACELIGLKIDPALALEALTKDSDNSEDHGEDKVNFKSGMGPNYERLEFMGDCFLKMATSISTFVLQPDENEFEFHVRRMCMLCNRNLMKAAQKHKLYEYIRTMAFNRRTWYPEGLRLTWGRGHNDTGAKEWTHSLGDKSVADICEALIGASFMQYNEQGHFDGENWDMAVKATKIFVDSEDHLMEKWSDYYAAYEKPKYQLAEATASQLDMARKVEQIHPYHFEHPRLLRSAFIHPSQAFMWENIPNYQRLEFLGDSLLDQAFIMHIFYRYPDKDPQWLTEHKMPMVSNHFLGSLCVKLGFYRFLRQNQSGIENKINDWVMELEQAEKETNGAVDYWTQVSEPPKCLADMVEAFVGAMFVDSEFDFSVVQKFFDLHIKRYFEDMSLYDEFAGKHPTNRLNKLLNLSLGCKNHRMAACETDSIIAGNKQIVAMLAIHGKVVFDAMGKSARYARIRCSNNALEKLEGLNPYDYRMKYGCDCEWEDKDEQKDGAGSENVVELKAASLSIQEPTNVAILHAGAP